MLLPRKMQEGPYLEREVPRTSTGIRNCRAEDSLTQCRQICCYPKPDLPRSGHFQGIFPWKVPWESPQSSQLGETREK